METQHHPVPPGVIKLGYLVAGAAAGTGIALGAWYQPTTANIHSGYAWQGVFEAIFLFLGGGLVGGGAGFTLGSIAARRRRRMSGTFVALAALAVAGVVGWAAMVQRPTIDCDYSDYCETH